MRAAYYILDAKKYKALIALIFLNEAHIDGKTIIGDYPNKKTAKTAAAHLSSTRSIQLVFS